MKALIVKLDKVFSLYIRLRDKGKCFTCGVVKDYREMDAGHFISRRHNITRWNEQNVQAQCTYCNRFQHGNLAEYTVRLQNKYGIEAVRKLLAQKRITKKFIPEELENLIAHYKAEVVKLSQ